MEIHESIPLAPKTTMHIGGAARYYAELATKEDVKEAWAFAQEKSLPLVALGSGSNTVFADGTIEALVVRVVANALEVTGNSVRAEAGMILASLVALLAKQGLDLSPLTGIPGTVGGAIFGNAGQGPKGLWTNHFVESVTLFADGEWQTLSKAQCAFAYRESIFKRWPESRMKNQELRMNMSPIIWEILLTVPSRPAEEIEKEITSLFKRRLENQPYRSTAGSCFKALPDGTPAWKLIDQAGFRGQKFGGILASPKHANFLINTGSASFEDVWRTVEMVHAAIPELSLEMRLVGNDGQTTVLS